MNWVFWMSPVFNFVKRMFNISDHPPAFLSPTPDRDRYIKFYLGPQRFLLSGSGGGLKHNSNVSSSNTYESFLLLATYTNAWVVLMVSIPVDADASALHSHLSSMSLKKDVEVESLFFEDLQ
jgi:hypothetical protein